MTKIDQIVFMEGVGGVRAHGIKEGTTQGANIKLSQRL